MTDAADDSILNEPSDRGEILDIYPLKVPGSNVEREYILVADLRRWIVAQHMVSQTEIDGGAYMRSVLVALQNALAKADP